jgi:uncharacterized protein (TIGR02118 family)
MIKIVALIPRRPDVSPEAFQNYYEQHHAPLFQRSIPPEVAGAITHYVQNHTVQMGNGTTQPAYDCVTEIGFDDLDGMRLWSSWYLGDGGKVLRDDEENFMDLRGRIVIVTDERKIGTGR